MGQCMCLAKYSYGPEPRDYYIGMCLHLRVFSHIKKSDVRFQLCNRASEVRGKLKIVARKVVSSTYDLNKKNSDEFNRALAATLLSKNSFLYKVRHILFVKFLQLIHSILRTLRLAKGTY